MEDTPLRLTVKETPLPLMGGGRTVAFDNGGRAAVSMSEVTGVMDEGSLSLLLSISGRHTASGEGSRKKE